MCESEELAQKLARRNKLNEGEEGPQLLVQRPAPKNVYIEFPEFTRKQIKEYEDMFKKYDTDHSKFLDFTELKYMMEKLDAPQTHLSLKGMIKEVDEDHDGQISFREFLLIFRKAALGELEENPGLCALANLTEIDVDETGVGGAKDFFEAKIQKESATCKFEEEIRKEQEEKRLAEEAACERKKAFRDKAKSFEML